MSQQSAIEWTEATWNPVTGCDRISPGCDHCYALALAARLKRMGQPRYQRDGDPRTSGPGFGVTLHPDKLGEPLRWRKPRTVFVNSMSDLFHKDVPAEFIGRVFNVMGSCPQHTFQVLTKRPKRMRKLVNAYYEATRQDPFPNVWLGTSIESRDYAWRADHLRATPAAVRFISAEPLLGPLVPINLRPDEDGCYLWILREADSVVRLCDPGLDLSNIDWVIAGGESGPDHRPMERSWVVSLLDACLDYRAFDGHRIDYDDPTGPRFFFKQWGGRTPKSGGRELGGRTWDEMPGRSA